MTLPSSGPISINDVCAEYGVPNNTPFPSGFYGKPGFPSSGPWGLSDCYGLSNVVFTPDGGSAAGSAPSGTASVTLSCNFAATWTYSISSGTSTGTSVSIGSGGSATSITFNLAAPGTGTRTTVWTVTGVSNGVTRNFTVTLDAGS